MFRYNGDTPFMNDERACAEYFCCARSAFTDIPDADDLVHAQVFKDMARSYAQVLLLSFLCMCSAFLFFQRLIIGLFCLVEGSCGAARISLREGSEESNG